MSLAVHIQRRQKLVNAAKLAPLGFLFVFAAVDLAWAVLAHLSFVGFELTVYGVSMLLAVSLVYGKFRVDRRLSEAAYYVALWSLFTAAAAPFTYLAATLGFPMHDELFVRIDDVLGFDWPSYYQFFTQDRFMQGLLLAAYSSFIPQILFSVIFFAHTHRHDRNNELFWTAAISLVVTGLASGIFPAAGAIYHFGTGTEHAVHLHDYFALRNGDVSQFAIGQMEGIVTFPSYHTVIALLMMYVYRGTGMFRFILVLNMLMLVSIPIFGGHYLTDMLGGAAIAAMAIYASRQLRMLLDERTSQ